VTKGRPNPGTPLCGAPRRARDDEDPDGEYFCRRAAGHGTEHLGFGRCRYHGGTSPTHMVHADRERRERDLALAAEEVARLGLPVDIDPHDALLAEVHRAHGYVAYVQLIVSSLDDDELVQTNRLPGGGSTVTKSVWVDMYESAQKLLLSACQAAIRCGVEERRVRIAERQGELIAGAVKNILTDLGVIDHPLAAETVRRELSQAGSQLIALPVPQIDDAEVIDADATSSPPRPPKACSPDSNQPANA
jgi:hypothetical protein